MSLSRNPRKIAEDIADGHTSISQGALRIYTPGDIQSIRDNLDTVQRIVQSAKLDHGDGQAVQTRNLRLHRIQQTLLVLDEYARKQRQQH